MVQPAKRMFAHFASSQSNERVKKTGKCDGYMFLVYRDRLSFVKKTHSNIF